LWDYSTDKPGWFLKAIKGTSKFLDFFVSVLWGFRRDLIPPEAEAIVICDKFKY
jgi:hypothetical protein